MRTRTWATAVARTTAVAAALAAAGTTLPATAQTTAAEPVVLTSARDGDSEVYRQDADGSLHRLTRNRVADHGAVWSPDGTRVAWASARDGDDEVFVMDADGSDKRQLTHNTAADSAPAWSPDGSRIAFASTRDGGEAEVYVMRADGRVERRVTRTQPFVVDHEPTWTADGSIVFVSNRAGDDNLELYRVRPDGTGLTRLTSTPDGSHENAPDVSPDGRSLAFSSNRDGTHDLYVMGVDGSGLRRVGGDAALDDVRPRWTADGRRLVFSTFASAEGDVPETVWVVDADGTDRRRLTTWSADHADPRPAG